MKTLVPGLVLVCAATLIAAEDATQVVTIEKAGSYQVTVGQTVHFAFKYDGFAGQVITGLDVTIDNQPVKDPQVEASLDPNSVDVGVQCFVYKVEKAGTYKITIRPMIGQTKGRPREHTLTVRPS
jgi:hypothetical protein